MSIHTITPGAALPALELPAILLINPKLSSNVAMIYRLAACFEIPQIWHTGNRIGPEIGRRRRTRLPPEERLRGHHTVDLFKVAAATGAVFDHFDSAAAETIGVEFDLSAPSLVDLDHPRDAVYVFGPEDGALDPEVCRRCDRTVHIPVAHCLNLAMAVTAVLWDRQAGLVATS